MRQRLGFAECRTSGIACWVTYGREIENYLSPECLAKAYLEISEREPPGLKLSRFDSLEEALKRAYGKHWKRAWSYNAAKPDIARKIVSHAKAEHMGQQLRKDLEPVLEAIRAANS